MWYFISDPFWALACHMSLNFISKYVKGSLNMKIDQALANEYCIFRIVTFLRAYKLLIRFCPKRVRHLSTVRENAPLPAGF